MRDKLAKGLQASRMFDVASCRRSVNDLRAKLHESEWHLLTVHSAQIDTFNFADGMSLNDSYSIKNCIILVPRIVRLDADNFYYLRNQSEDGVLIIVLLKKRSFRC